jgi:WD40 repeat protein/serine/threonine protein kinase
MAARFQQVKEIFLAAVEQTDPGEREAYLCQACGEDAELRRQVEALLRRNEQTGSFLERPALEVTVPLAPGRAGTNDFQSETAGTRLGSYKLLQQIGEGGMGAVWMAEQQEPVRRLVAVKVIRAGLDSAQGVARFEQERQALALMDHPNIAKVLDGGTTGGEPGDVSPGRPYFVMELVQGTPITEYCDEHRLTPRQRLELFLPVCRALQHAHQKGIIHRDVKPSNVLVAPCDGRPVVKVIDFGIAKAAGLRLTERTLYTEFGAVIGTPEYMSPEQAELNNQDIDTRSDVYSLGVLLYELLTGTTPLTAERLKQATFLELLRAIREEEPPRPSSRLSDSKEALASIAAQRQTEPVKLRKLLRGELDWIVMKALEKDRSRRYETANGLARDIERYLNDEPVEACPPSPGYRLRKLLRRYRGPVAAAGGILAALVLGLVGTTLFALRAQESARQAKDEERVAHYQTYRARIATASAALTGHDVVDAAHQLAEAPEALRGWEWHHLHSRLDDSAAVIRLEADEAIELARSSDGLRVVAFTDARVRVLDLDGHELLARSFPGAGNVLYVDLLSSRGLSLVAHVGDEIQVADEEGRVRARLPGVSEMTTSAVCLSQDGSRLAMAWRNPKGWAITLYELNAAKPAAIRVSPGSYIWGLAISPDNTRFASAGEDGVTRVWDSVTGKMTAECGAHRSKVLSVAYRADGQRLVTTSADGSVRQWNPATGREAAPAYKRHTGEVITAAYSPDGTWIASGGYDRTIRVWRAADAAEAAVLHGHTGFVREVAFTANGRRVISMGAYMGALGLGYAGTGDGTVRLWEAPLPGVSLPVLRGHTSYLYPVVYSPDGRWIASGGWDRRVCLWDARTGELCTTFPHRGTVRALAFGPDSSWLVSACDWADQLQVWDVATGRRRQEVKGPGPVVQAVTVSPDGTWIAAVERGGVVSVSEMATGREVASWRGDRVWLEKKALAYSPDGRWLAGTGEDKELIDIWDAQTHQRSARLAGHTGPIYFVAFSPDGRRLASAGNDRTVRIWDVTTEECVAVLHGHTDEVFAVAFHPDGTRLASAGRDRVIWLWDLATWQEVARLQGHLSYIFSLAFSPDGKSLVSSSGDGTVRLWDTAPLAVRYQARREAEALRPKAEQLVERLFGEQNDPAAVVAALWADRALGEPLRQAAFRAVLRRRAR